MRWLAGWYATRLHAVSVIASLKPKRTYVALCGAEVYETPPTQWAQKLVDKGPPRCKRCLRRIEAMG